MNIDYKNSEGFPLEPTTTTGSHLSAPEKAALSNTTTMSVDPDHGPRVSKDSGLLSVQSNPFDTDMEANHITGYESGQSMAHAGSRTPNASRSDCRAWPGKDHWKQKAKEAKKNRSCTPMANMSKRNRIIMKILIVLFIVGIGVGVGFGVSKPLGAPIWGDKH
ncbi:hypothetical protein N3K66_007135 [Trichothecium roseum]|uniref:Uncharacterized protein n=1 Tax=Trichothecium roseum TaxID=47278 RepID=A0ACC0UX91_9HYPO|nr:hypothetical protein N3K66_007135 [Trichothecium roseum]